MTKNVLDYLYTSKEKFPLKTAVADNVSSMTYTELVDNATTIAVALLKYTGARRAVPIYMDKSCVTLAAFMGVVMTGNFYVLLEPAHPAERIHSILDTLFRRILLLLTERMRRRLQSLSLQAILYTLKTCLKHRLQMRTERSFRILRQMLLI